MGRQQKRTTVPPNIPPDMPVRSAQDWGARLRLRRGMEGLRLEDVSDTTLLGLRFLSELERGKPGASLQKAIEAANAIGLEVLLVPREHSERLRQYHHQLLRAADASSADNSETDT